MSERRYRNDLDLDARSPGSTSSAAPGRATLTSRHVMRKARDANGVASDADTHVERAAGSSGSPLPDELRRRFEESLGTDLSSVRVHTGATSQLASAAVGARAYTVGQDVHFGAGQYDPASSAGRHLIAHEVAHTVQQQGGTPTRQNKLEVSRSSDALERDADRAADALVAGESYSIFPQSRGGLMRDADELTTDKMLEHDIDGAEKMEQKQQASPQYKPGAILTCSVTQAEARNKLQQVRAATKDLEFHISMSSDGITWSQVEQNHKTIGLLQDYSNTRDEQAIDYGAVITGTNTLRTDFARLNQSVATVCQQTGLDNKAITGTSTPDNPIDPNKPLNAEGQLGQKVGEKFGEAIVGGDKDTARTGSADLGKMRIAVNQQIDTYNQSCNKVNSSEARVKSASSKLKSATASLTLFNLKEDQRELAGQLQDAQAKAQEIASTVSTVTGLVVQCAGVSGGLGTLLSSIKNGGDVATMKPSVDPLVSMLDSNGKDLAKGTVDGVITQILTHSSGIAKQIADLSGKLAVKGLEAVKTEKDKEASLVTAAAEDLKAAINDYKTDLEKVDADKRTLRSAMADYGAELDQKSAAEGTGSGTRFVILGRVMGECDAFLGQAKIVWTSVQRAKASRSGANDKRSEVETTVKGGDAHDYGAAYYYLEQDRSGGYLTSGTSGSYLVTCENIQFHGLDLGKEGEMNPAEALAAAETDIRKQGSMAFGMRNQLAGFMGLSVNGSPPEFTSGD